MLTEADEKQLSEFAETAGWRRRDINGVTVWTLRGFDGGFSFVEMIGLTFQGWAAQRLAALTKPFYLDRSFWLTLLSSCGGLATALINELIGSQNHILSSAGMAIAAAAPFIGKYIHDQAKTSAALDMRRAQEYWDTQPPPRPLPALVPVVAPVDPPR